jgi:TonB-dependent starch-binding outer membrane protein SusC
VNYRPFNWFSNRFVAGVDRTASHASIISLPNSSDSPAGFAAEQRPSTYIYSLDYAGNVNYEVSPALATTTSFGAQVISNQTTSLRATGTGLGAPAVTLIGTATTITGLNSFSEFNSVGYYLQEQLAWENRLFLIGAVRADDHSSFGTDFDIILYPKFSLSYIASEEPALKGIFEMLRADNFKFRTAWGQAGRAPSPYAATQTYIVDRATLGTTTVSAIRTGAFGNPNLKPEKGTEIEVGFDASFLGNRLGSEFTWYNKKTTDMLVAQPIAPSTGFIGSRTVNIGSVKNSGVELSLTGTPVQTARVSWDARLNLASNKNVLLDIPDTSGRAAIGGQAYGLAQQNKEGYPLGGYWASRAQRDAQGVPIVNAAGAVQFTTDTIYMGPPTPTREISLSNTMTLFRNWRLYALLDHKGGHYLFNQRLRNQCQAANDVCEMNNVNLGARNVTAATVGTATPADAAAWKELQYRRTTAGNGSWMIEEWIEPADFVKLREVSLSYILPTDWAARFGAGSMNITVAGRNLATWTDYRGADPEVNSYGGRLFARADTYTVPNLRRFTATLNLSF